MAANKRKPLFLGTLHTVDANDAYPSCQLVLGSEEGIKHVME